MEVRGIRSTRTLKVTEVRVPPEEQQMLAQLANDPRYNALLNLMERACIEIDAGMVNTPVNDPEGILGAHCVSKAAWIFFTYIQKKVLNAYEMQDRGGEPEKDPSFEEMIQGTEWTEEHSSPL